MPHKKVQDVHPKLAQHGEPHLGMCPKPLTEEAILAVGVKKSIASSAASSAATSIFCELELHGADTQLKTPLSVLQEQQETSGNLQ